ncbi:MAG TPA: hypothetical protein DCP17_08455 [Ruminococcaceae bacterium]|nr:hypothetical protein [Oscillospiraceae bacterium]
MLIFCENKFFCEIYKIIDNSPHTGMYFLTYCLSGGKINRINHLSGGFTPFFVTAPKRALMAKCGA